MATNAYNPYEDYISCYAKDRIADHGESSKGDLPGSAGDEGAPRPSRGRESDGKGVIEWEIFENEDGTTTYVYSFKGPIQAMFKLVLPASYERAKNGRELCRMFEDLFRELVFLRPPVPVLPRSISGRHERDVRGGSNENVRSDYDDSWVVPMGFYQGFPGDWKDSSRYEPTYAEDEGPY